MGGRPVVPPRATSLHVLLNSHGNAHPRHSEKVDCGLDEHYMHFPHPVPPDAEALYESVAWRGDANVDGTEPYGPRKFRWRLYSTMLFQSLLRAQRAHPARTTVVLNQSCLSAGHARFLEVRAFHGQQEVADSVRQARRSAPKKRQTAQIALTSAQLLRRIVDNLACQIATR